MWLSETDTLTVPQHAAWPRALLRRWAVRAGLLLAALAFAALWAYPLLGFLLSAWIPHVLQGDLRMTLAPLRQAAQGYALHALWNSLWVALLVGALALPLGAWLAWLRVRTDLPARGWIEAGVWLLLIFPDFFLASGWMLLAAPIGPLAHWPAALRLAQLLLGPAGIVITLALKTMPYVYLVTQGSLQNSSAALQEAARVHGLSRA